MAKCDFTCSDCHEDGAAIERKPVLRKVRAMMKHASRESELDLKDLAAWRLDRDRLAKRKGGK